MRTLLVTAFLSLSCFASAQFYYQDIVGTQDINNRMKALLAAKVKTVTASGYDQQNVKTQDYDERHEVWADARTLKVTTRNNRNFSTVYYQFDNNTRLIGTRDSSSVQVISTYSYDNKGNLVSIKSVAKDIDSLQNFSASEEHQWIWGNGKPQKMWRIVNEKDSFEYRFSPDEQGYIAEEKLIRYGAEADFVYYYYDKEGKGRITDVVRFNKTLMSLIPDMMLYYNENGQLQQKVTPVSYKNPNYLTWVYAYDEKGLKTREALFNKNKERTGTIIYQYTYGQ